MIRLAQNAALLLVSVLVALLIGEVAVRFIMPQNLSGSWRVVHPSGLLMNKSQGEARHQFGDVVVHYRFGENGSRLLASPPAPGGGKILVLGDSFTFGWLLEDEATFANALQKQFPGKTVINAAAGGWGTADYAKYIELFCSKIGPNEIYIFLNTDDIGRAYRSTLFRLAEDGRLIPGPPAPPGGLKQRLNGIAGYQWLIEHSHLVALVRSVFLSQAVEAARQAPAGAPAPLPGSEMGDAKQLSDAVSLGNALFARIARDSAACGSKVTVFYTGWADLAKARQSTEPTMRFLVKAGEDRLFEANGMRFFDLSGTAAMKATYADRARYTIPVDGHPNARGAAAIFHGAMEALASAPPVQ